MNIEEIIRAWKAEEDALEPQAPNSPVGRELSEQELLEIEGAFPVFQLCIVREQQQLVRR